MVKYSKYNISSVDLMVERINNKSCIPFFEMYQIDKILKSNRMQL